MYRGKRIDNGEWVEGYWLQTGLLSKTSWIIKPNLYEHDIRLGINPERPKHLQGCYKVHPDTVGQATGLKDIWQGDEIRWKYIAVEDDTGATEEVEAEGVVVFERGCFVVESDCDGFTGKPCLNYITAMPFEIIGTIHEETE